jgi:hypothetical protein
VDPIALEKEVKEILQGEVKIELLLPSIGVKSLGCWVNL